jgi:hypothetical protein
MDLDALPEVSVLENLLPNSLSESSGLSKEEEEEDDTASKDLFTQPSSVSSSSILLKFNSTLCNVFLIQSCLLICNWCVLLNDVKMPFDVSSTTFGVLTFGAFRGLLVIVEVVTILIIVFVVGSTSMVHAGRDSISHLKTD